MRIKIQPYEQIQRKVLSELEIAVDKVKLNSSATIHVSIFDKAGAYADFKTLPLEGNDYAKWASDDSYIVNFVLQHLGFEAAATEPDAEQQEQKS